MTPIEQLSEALRTISAISVVSYLEDYAIAYDRVEANFNYLVDHGMKVIVVGGNTGEFASLTPEENRRLVELAIKTIAGRALVVAGVGNDICSAVEAARHAEKAGCDAVMVHHPTGPFFTQEGYYQYLRSIGDSTGLGIIPYIRHANVQNSTVLRLAELSNLIAFKYAVNDLQHFGALVMATRDRDDLTWICGTAEGWAPLFYAMGATGFTSGLVNVAPRLSLRMLSALQSGDFASAREQWLLVKPFEDLRARQASEFNVPAVKEAMAQLGLASRRVRPPLSEMPEAGRASVATFLESLL